MRRFSSRWLLAGALTLGLGAFTPSVRADDVADEADLRFQLGADAYQRGDFREALQHFLASNRLAPNRNVVFNIARSYEQLRRYPEAFRYYALALDGETDESARGRIQAALEQIRVHVAVLEVLTDPPGATIYIDRRDLGARGESPRRLGLPAGRYRVIAELAGHYPAETAVDEIKLGDSRAVRLKLEPVLGVLRMEGDARGALVRVDDEKAPICRIPCRVTLAPGRRSLHLELAGHRPLAIEAEISARQTLTLRPKLERLTGSLVVGTDEQGALIEVDGQPLGFTPAILTLPVGEHRVRVTLEGFRSAERVVRVTSERRARLDVSLTQSEEVTAASRVTQTVEEAPSSVTIIPRQELRAFGYPTIAEAVRGVRGVYLWDDRSYVTVGFRGLGRLGGYGNRVLVLNDGHPANDDWIGSSYVGYDARTDVADVERIEVIRGPGSVLYGTNAFSGVINLVPRQRDVPRGAEISVSTADYGVARGRVRADARIGRDGGIWTSIAGARGEGRDFFFPEYATETTPGLEGNARSIDGFEAGTLHGGAFWRSLTAQWFLHSHGKNLPNAPFETAFGDARLRQTDTRAYVEARAEPKLSRELQLSSRVHLNHYRFRGVYPRAIADGGLEVDTFRGSWLGFEQRLVVTPNDALRLTLGGEGQLHFQVEQRARDDAGFFLDEERPFQVGAAYVLSDVAIGKRFDISAGARLDAYSTFGRSLNPRLALIYRPYERGVSKLLFGKAFRAPSIYELYYNDGGFTQIASPDLKPESIYSLELEHSHRFSPTITATVAAFANYVTDLLVPRGAGDESDPTYSINSASPLGTFGAELGIRRDWRQGWMIAASYAFQRSRFLESNSARDLLGFVRDPNLRNVENSPEQMASLKAAAPIISRALTLASRISVEGPRYDRHEIASDPAQQLGEPFVIWDLVLSGQEQRFGLFYSLGVYNVFDWQYALPVSGEFRARTIVQSGRTLLAAAELAF